MAFIDKALIAPLMKKKVEGLAISNPDGMTLTVASGSVHLWQTGQTYVLDTEQSHTFTPHNKWKKVCFIGIISNDTTTDLWVDEYIHHGANIQGDPPDGYKLHLTLAWFEIEPNVVDFSTTVINRRVYV